jgi:hypothetical protein
VQSNESQLIFQSVKDYADQETSMKQAAGWPWMCKEHILQKCLMTFTGLQIMSHKTELFIVRMLEKDVLGRIFGSTKQAMTRR